MRSFFRSAIWAFFGACISAPAADFWVTSPADTGATGTLRWAMGAANSNASPPHVIKFNLPPPYVITITNQTPAITNRNVLVDGITQTNYVPGSPAVRISLVSTSSTLEAFRLLGNGCAVQGLAIDGNNLDTVGVYIGARTNRVSGCVIQSNRTAVSLFGLSGVQSHALIGGSVASNRNYLLYNDYAIAINNTTGGFNRISGNHILNNSNSLSLSAIDLSTTSGNTIGGSEAERNVISGNTAAGISIAYNCRNNEISHNYIGLDPAGAAALGNRGFGIKLGGTANNVFANYIAGNSSSGIYLSGETNQIYGNIIGLATNGNALGNADGIFILGQGNEIYTNVISGNNPSGITLFGTYASDNDIVGNIIGLDPSGTLIRSNRSDGIFIIGGAANNRIGWVYPFGSPLPNVISGNGRAGVYILGDNNRSNIIAHNFIGTDKTGTAAIGNLIGILLDTVQDAIIGYTLPNVISGNKSSGIKFFGTNTANVSVNNNFIGVDATGTNGLGNGYAGIEMLGACGVDIGSLAGNIISASSNSGIYIYAPQSTWSNITIANNIIGLDTNGTRRLANEHGIHVGSPGQNLLISSNVISGNRQDGVKILGGSITSNYVMRANKIGVTKAGNQAAGNGANGISVENGQDIRIGGTNSIDRNIIGGSGDYGIYIYSCTNRAVYILGNSIGVDAAGASALTNSKSGVKIVFSKGVEVGSAEMTEGNYLSGNQDGIEINDSAESKLIGNSIGSRPAIIPVPGNRRYGIWLNGAGCVSNIIDRNLIAGSSSAGIFMNSEVQDTFIRGNNIGVGSSPMQPGKGNQGPGISIVYCGRNFIGGSDASNANRIAFNTGPGVSMTNFPGAMVRGPYEITGNLIYSNGGIAIDLNNDGVTVNDPAPDADIGYPNDLQNYPVLDVALLGSTQVEGKLISQPNQTYRLEFFGTDPLQGMVFVGATNYTLPASGTGSFSYVFSTTLATNALVYATATGTNGTSEFSAPVALDASGLDTDGDKMPDWWEQLHGLNKNDPGDAGSDFDMDSFSALDEWIAYTEPDEEKFYPRITSIEGVTNRIVTFPSGVRVYRLDYSQILEGSTNWVYSGSMVTGTIGNASLIDSNAAGPRFYRVRAALP